MKLTWFVRTVIDTKTLLYIYVRHDVKGVIFQWNKKYIYIKLNYVVLPWKVSLQIACAFFLTYN